MRIVIFGGTTEGRLLSRALSEAGAALTVCTATDYGTEEQGILPGTEVLQGPFSPEEKQAILTGAALCVDATHPYARHISASVRAACRAAGVEYLRLLREESDAPGVKRMDAAADAAAYLSRVEGRILLTTGSRELSAFSGLEPCRLYPRILPTCESIKACEAMGIPHRNIIAMQGPFSRELNIAILRQYQIRWLVTKDGGIPGGFPEKLQAAQETGATLLLLSRPEERGLPYDEVLHRCLSALRKEGTHHFSEAHNEYASPM